MLKLIEWFWTRGPFMRIAVVCVTVECIAYFLRTALNAFTHAGVITASQQQSWDWATDVGVFVFGPVAVIAALIALVREDFR
jgi:hypothetical protein